MNTVLHLLNFAPRYKCKYRMSEFRLFPSLHRVEDRNDLMAQKMRRYVNAFTREGEGGGGGLVEREREEGEKAGGGGGAAPDPWNPQLRGSKRRRGFNSRSHAAWQVIRRSALSMDLQPEEVQVEEVQEEEVGEEVQDIRFV